jgi:hypothetical protein
MTAAQKTAKANFKKAIEYRKKTGVSLKEAFAHVYGKKVGATPKKKAAKKAAPKKAAKKVAKKAAPKKVVKKAAPKKHTKYGKVKAHTRRVSGVKKRKPISEKTILNKIHKVKDQVNKLDEAQHKHMIGKISQHNVDKIKSSLQELKQLETHLAILKNAKPKIVKSQLPVIRREIKNTVNSIKEVKTHITQLKKNI